MQIRVLLPAAMAAVARQDLRYSRPEALILS